MGDARAVRERPAAEAAAAVAHLSEPLPAPEVSSTIEEPLPEVRTRIYCRRFSFPQGSRR